MPSSQKLLPETEKVLIGYVRISTFQIYDEELSMCLGEDINEAVELIVKVFVPAKAKNDHINYLMHI